MFFVLIFLMDKAFNTEKLELIDAEGLYSFIVSWASNVTIGVHYFGYIHRLGIIKTTFRSWRHGLFKIGIYRVFKRRLIIIELLIVLELERCDLSISRRHPIIIYRNSVGLS